METFRIKFREFWGRISGFFGKIVNTKLEEIFLVKVRYILCKILKTSET